MHVASSSLHGLHVVHVVRPERLAFELELLRRNWRAAAGRSCSDVALSSSGQGPRPAPHGRYSRPSLPEPTGVACTKAVSGVRHISSPCTSRAASGCAICCRSCSDVALSSSGQGPRPPRQTRSCSSVSALAAAAVVPVVGSAALRVDPGHSRAACIETRAAAMPLAAPFALDQLQQQRMAGTAGLRCQSRLAWRVPRP